MTYIVMVYIVVAYIVEAYVVMAGGGWGFVFLPALQYSHVNA